VDGGWLLILVVLIIIRFKLLVKLVYRTNVTDYGIGILIIHILVMLGWDVLVSRIIVLIACLSNVVLEGMEYHALTYQFQCQYQH
jgi:hypothetical protein